MASYEYRRNKTLTFFFPAGWVGGPRIYIKKTFQMLGGELEEKMFRNLKKMNSYKGFLQMLGATAAPSPFDSLSLLVKCELVAVNLVSVLF